MKTPMNLIISFVSAGVCIVIGAGLGYAVGQAMTIEASIYIGTTLLVYLKDEAGIVDTLETGNRDAAGNLYIRHRTTGQVFTILPRKAELLFPTARALLDTLPKPSPYQTAEPSASFLFR